MTSARARPVLEVKDLRAYFSTEAGPVRAVNGVISTVGEGGADIGRREMLLGAATCMRGIRTACREPVSGNVRECSASFRRSDASTLSRCRALDAACRGEAHVMILRLPNDCMTALVPGYAVTETMHD